MTAEYDRWNSRTVRRPDDVRTIAGGPVPLPWVVEKHTVHSDRLANNDLPADFEYDVERGDAGDALAVIALREAIRRDLEYGRGVRVLDAVKLGATWTEVGAALDVTAEEARGVLRRWAAGQHHLNSADREIGYARPLGLDADGYRAVLALCALEDGGEPACVVVPEKL